MMAGAPGARSSCAGAILDFPDRGNAEELACWVPFDEVVAVAWA